MFMENMVFRYNFFMKCEGNPRGDYWVIGSRYDEYKGSSEKDTYGEKKAEIRKRFNGKVIELVDFCVLIFFKYLNGGVSSSYDEVCGKSGKRSKGETLWWNEEVKRQYQERCAQVNVYK